MRTVSGPPLPLTSSTEADRLRAMVAARFPVYETRITPRSLVLLVHADPATLEARFDELRQVLWEYRYVPQIRHEGGEYLIEVVRRPPRSAWGPWANLSLLALTIVSTAAAGAFLWLSYRGGSTLGATDFVLGGLFFAAPLMAMLGLHELAHYVVARHHHVDASLPYFIPVPPPFLLFGTFGAFISLREPIPSKKALIDIGASGPLAGFAVAIPVTLVGMVLSVHAPMLSVANCGPTILGVGYGNLEFGTSLFWAALGLFVPVSAFANLHPLALAGWVGLLVTAINLLPAGQLDGGHVFRALFGDKARYVSYAAVALLVGLGFLYSGWFLFALLIFVLGMRHPPPLNDITPLDAKRWLVGAFAVGILISGFVIQPIGTPSGTFDVSKGPVSNASTPPAGYAMAASVSINITDKDLIPHGYLLSSTIDFVAANVNNRTTLLNGSALRNFENNSTWVVVLPGGKTLTFAQSATFALPSSQFVQLDTHQTERITVTYLNHHAGAVTFVLAIRELCAPQVPSAQARFSV